MEFGGSLSAHATHCFSTESAGNGHSLRSALMSAVQDKTDIGWVSDTKDIGLLFPHGYQALLRSAKFSWKKVRIALNLNGHPFEYVPISSTKKKSYLQLNPQALMPTLEVGGLPITQSLPAIEFINEQFLDPPLLSYDPVLRAQSRSFAVAICAELHALTVKRVRRYLSNTMSVDDGLVGQWYADWTSSTLGALEQTVRVRKQATTYCFADFPTIADIALVPQFANARRFNCDLSSYSIMTEI